MSKGQKLRALVNERLTAAAAEIFELFERTIAEYEQEVLLLTQRNHKQQLLASHTADVQIVSGSQEEAERSLEPPHTQKEPELCIKQEEEEQLQEFPVTPVCMKTEDDEDKSSVLHQRATEENREETNGEDCGAEAGCSSDPLTQLHSDSEEHTDSSSDTDHSEDYSQEQAPSKRSYAMISPDSFVTDAKPYRCSECGKGFNWKSDLQVHMSAHSDKRPHKCSVCEKSFKLKWNLNKHLRVRHHTCPVCKKGFIKTSDLKEHLKTHVEDGTLDQSSVIIPDTPVNDVEKNSKTYRCSECGKGFPQNFSLQRHMLIHSGRKPYKCSVCGQECRLKSHLQSHMRSHTGEKPFECSDCKKCFSEKGNLTRHMKTHTGDKPFSCSFCEKEFTEKCNLKTHLRIHTGEKPFICPVCKKHFSDHSSVKRHITVHGSDKQEVVISLLQN